MEKRAPKVPKGKEGVICDDPGMGCQRSEQKFSHVRSRCCQGIEARRASSTAPNLGHSAIAALLSYSFAFVETAP